MCTPCLTWTVGGITYTTPNCDPGCLMKNGGVGQNDYIDVSTIYQDECQSYFGGNQGNMTLCMAKSIIRNSENDPEAIDVTKSSKDANRRIIQIAALIVLITILIALILWV